MADDTRELSNKFRLAGMGFELLGAVGGGCLLGWYIDHKFGTSYGLLTGALLGIVGGMYNVVKQSLKIVQSGQNLHNEPDDDVGNAD